MEEEFDEYRREEEEEISVRLPNRHVSVAEDEEFDKELSKLVHESMESRRLEGRSQARLDINMTIPMNLLRTSSMLNTSRGRVEEQAVGEVRRGGGERVKGDRQRGRRRGRKRVECSSSC